MFCPGLVNDMQCEHSYAEHFFKPWDCEELPLAFRVSALAFHVLTLGIPLIIYQVANVYLAYRDNIVLETAFENVAKLAVRSVDNNNLLDKMALSQFGKETLEEAMQLLKANPDEAQPLTYSGWSEMEQPLNPLISRLHSLYIHFINQGSKKESLTLSFALGYLTLIEIPEFVAKNGYPCPAYALCQQSCFQFKTIYKFLTYYHQFRAGVDDLNKLPRSFNGKAPLSTSDAQGAPFYQDGTEQNNWRLLYNDYCNMIHTLYGTDQFIDTNPITPSKIERLNSYYYMNGYNRDGTGKLGVDYIQHEPRLIIWAIPDTKDNPISTLPDTTPSGS